MFWGSEYRIQGLMAQGSGFGIRVQSLSFRVQGSGFRVQGSGFRVQGLGFRRADGRCFVIYLAKHKIEGALVD